MQLQRSQSQLRNVAARGSRASQVEARQNHSSAIVAGAGAFVAFVVIITAALDQLQSALIIMVLLAGLTALSPRLAIVVTFIYLAIMGDLRRYLVTNAGVTTNDPMLLVGPVVLVLLLLTALLKGQISFRSEISKPLLLLVILMCLEILNPLQGGVYIGIAGALFFLVPVLWFWVGQAFGSSEFLQKVLKRVVVPIAVAASLLGLTQAFFGFLHYEARWFHLMTESSIHPDIRPFSFFCSWGEYPFYVATGLLVVLVPLFQGRIRISAVFAPLFILALLIQSVREPIFESILALAVLWSVIGARSRAAMGGRLVVGLLVGGGLLVVAMTQLKEVDAPDEVKAQIDHTTDGVLEIQNSSAGGHVDMIGAGMVLGITNPIGYGLGYPSVQAAGGYSSEIDFSDVFVACGVGGGVLNLYIMFIVIRTVIRFWRGQRDPFALYVLAILMLELGHWTAGGLYAVSPLTWFAIGSLDRAATDALSLQAPVARRAAAPRRLMRSSISVASRPA